ncbi:hypothetical protein [Phyllobacterium bourgognense]|uniref:hypothetical protein n=1 Tax=Phyllobacterium bourgognense TaxID=314236 RepID=UPI0011C039AB|nr:hypothetical protein [Phyllobacterium bourgognense]
MTIHLACSLDCPDSGTARTTCAQVTSSKASAGDMSVVASYLYRQGRRAEAITIEKSGPQKKVSEFFWIGVHDPSQEELATPRKFRRDRDPMRDLLRPLCHMGGSVDRMTAQPFLSVFQRTSYCARFQSRYSLI